MKEFKEMMQKYNLTQHGPTWIYEDADCEESLEITPYGRNTFYVRYEIDCRGYIKCTRAIRTFSQVQDLLEEIFDF